MAQGPLQGLLSSRAADGPVLRAASTIIALDDDGTRTVFLLCAHIDGDEWFVHQGSYDNGTLAAHSFQEKDLVYKDIAKEAWDTSSRKRLRSNNQLNTLRGYVKESDYLWREVVAVANFRAVELRSKRQST